MRLRAKHLVGFWMLPLFSVAALGAAGSDPRLLDAVKNRDEDALRALLKQKIDVNVAEGDGATALHWAVHRDDLDAATLLISAGARVNAANDYGVTPLSLACTNRNSAMVEKLLAAGATPTATLSTGETVLMTCARTGHPDTVKALLARGANVNAKETRQGQTALMWAAAHGYAEVVRALIEGGADVRARSNVSRVFVASGLKGELRGTSAGFDYDRGGFTPLLFAARQGSIETARLLLVAGAEVDDAAADGASPLVVASLSGHGKLGAFLLENGADPNAAGAGYTALHAAVLRGDLELVEALVARGANPNAQLTKGTPVPRLGPQWALPATLAGVTPYLLAAKFAAAEIMRVLRIGGADPKLTMKDGTTALMAAAGVGSPSRDRRMRILAVESLGGDDERRTLEAVKVAIEGGADANASNAAG